MTTTVRTICKPNSCVIAVKFRLKIVLKHEEVRKVQSSTIGYDDKLQLLQSNAGGSWGTQQSSVKRIRDVEHSRDL